MSINVIALVDRQNTTTNNFHESNVEIHNLKEEHEKHDKLKIEQNWIRS